MLSTGIRTAALDLAARRAFGGLLPLLDDPELRDMLLHVEGGRARLRLDRGAGPRAVSGWSTDPAALARFAVRLVAAGGRHLDELHPCVDVRVGDGIRVHAVLPPVSVSGAAVSIRVPRVRPLAFADLVAGGLCGPVVANRLAEAVSERRNILITGGTGSGNTTWSL